MLRTDVGHNSDDRESTTTTLRRIAPGLVWIPRILRENFTPAAAWSVLVLLFSAATTGAVFYGRATVAQTKIETLEHDVESLRKQQEVLGQINSTLAVLATKIDNLSQQVDEQRQKWDWVERQAEVPGKPKRSRK